MYAYRRTDRHAKILGAFRDCVNVLKSPTVVVYRMVYACILLRITIFYR